MDAKRATLALTILLASVGLLPTAAADDNPLHDPVNYVWDTVECYITWPGCLDLGDGDGCLNNPVPGEPKIC